MSGLSKLRSFLRTDSNDAGCGETIARLHVYVERQLASGDAGEAYPGIAAHLATCGPCREDYRGLLSLLS